MTSVSETGRHRWPRPVVFYDGGCSFCRAEIMHYRRLDRQGRLAWIDISKESGLVCSYGKPLDAMMHRLHVLDEAGNWKIGVEGFLKLWAQLPYYRLLARLVIFLKLKKPLEKAYALWADRRARGTTGCRDCNSPAPVPVLTRDLARKRGGRH